MIKVEFLGPINKKDMNIQANSIEQLSKILKLEDDLKDWLDNCAIAINDVLIKKNADIVLKDNDKVSLLPPVCGG